MYVIWVACYFIKLEQGVPGNPQEQAHLLLHPLAMLASEQPSVSALMHEAQRVSTRPLRVSLWSLMLV